MKKILTVIGGVLGVAVVGVLGAASLKPDVTHVERSLVMAAAPQDVFPYLEDYDKWYEWNPWAERDPAEKVTFSEVHHGEGAWTEWDGNDDVGQGRMTKTKVVLNERVEEDLHFMRPFDSHARAFLTVAPEGDGTKVTWGFDSDNSFGSKIMAVFMDMDAMIGPDFLHGLEKLKPLAEGAAKVRQRAEAEAATAAAAAAASAADPAEQGTAVGDAAK